MPDKIPNDFKPSTQVAWTTLPKDRKALALEEIAISLRRIADAVERGAVTTGCSTDNLSETQRLLQDVLSKQTYRSDDGWIDWAGGECPVPPETMVEVRFRDGEVSEEPREARFWSSAYSDPDHWTYGGDDAGGDIIAYRIAGVGPGDE